MVIMAYRYREHLGELPTQQEGTRDTEVVKLFTPDAGASWYLYEYDPATDIAFGLCDLGMGFPELGSVSVKELEAVRGKLKLPIEVDLSWDGTLADGYRALGQEVPSWLP